MRFRDAIKSIFAVVSGGALFAEHAEKKVAVGLAAATVALLSGIYLVRQSVFPTDLFPLAFSAEKCILDARSQGHTLIIRSRSGNKEVRDFRVSADVLSHLDYPAMKVHESPDFQVFFDPMTDHFTILMVLIDGSTTPLSAGNSSAQYLQHALCLNRNDICELNYRISAPRATNANFPELIGRDFEFSFCS